MIIQGTRENHTLLHLRDKILVKQSSGFLVKRAVDGYNITLAQHFLQRFHFSATNLLLLLRAQWLVIKVQQLLAVKGLKPPEHTLSNSSNGNSTNNLALKIVLVLGHLSDVPVSALDLLVGGDEVADQSEDSHDDVFSDGNDIGPCDFGDSDTAICLVGSVEVDVVGTDTSCHSKLEFLGFGEAFGG